MDTLPNKVVGYPNWSRIIAGLVSGYVAPANGWFNMLGDGGNYNDNLFVYINGVLVTEGHQGLGYGGAYQGFTIPCFKGDKLTYSNLETANTQIRFVYNRT